jgi:hypothetical protein
MEYLRRGVAAIDGRPWLAMLLLVTSLAAGVEIQLNFPVDRPAALQYQALNPDAKLYYGLAENLLSGAGFEDTTRHNDVMPSVGHPAVLALASGLAGWTPARQAWLALWATALLLTAAVRIYTGSNSYALAAVWLFAVYLSGIVWLAGNVETSIVLSNGLFVLCLAIFYRSGFGRTAAVVAGVALAAALLIRPIFLYALHAATLAAVLAAAYCWRQTGASVFPRIVTGWLLLLLTAQALMLATLGYSHARYGDPRLVSGTYGAWSLYGGNNPHIATDRVFRTRERHPPEFNQMLDYFQRADDWQERHEIFMNRVLRYWSEQPGRALSGWAWRLRRYFGFHADVFASRPNRVLWGPRVHPAAAAALVGLLALRFWRGRRRSGDRLEPALSLGVVTAGLFGVYAAIHALFAYSSFRYVTGGLTLLIAATAFLAAENWPPRPGSPPRARGAQTRDQRC